MSVLLAFVVLLVSLALGAFVWYRMRESSVNKLIGMFSRWKDDRDDPFRNCGDMTKHMEAMTAEIDRLGKWGGGKSAQERVLVVFQRDVDDNVKTLRGMDNWLRRQRDAVKHRLGCVQRLENGKFSFHPRAGAVAEE